MHYPWGRPNDNGLLMGILLVGLLAIPAASVRGQAVPEQAVAFRVAGIEVLGDGPGAATLGFGVFNPIEDRAQEKSVHELRVEYRIGEKWNGLGPMAGVLVNAVGGVFGYAGAYADLRLAERWLITPAVGVGAYNRSDGKRLGGVFQFHLGLDAAYRFRNGHRLGLKIAHISNASLQETNLGTESVLLTYTVPTAW
ncbi:acyloxyacyl hydrolase [Thiohalorhabdus methylotrophus]|uniref:Acyloxyacyl hydrolase n=1 Tax=Thiohalorhabdus methylotrophus TaxID=3242694 RepID=A0ABV4TUU8_9GAMM